MGKPDYRAHAFFLYGLLDDIDTLEDVHKANLEGYQKGVRKRHQRRFEAADTDGYSVVFKDNPNFNQNFVPAARDTIATAFKDDPHLRDCYVANIAMLLHDHYGIKDYETRTKAGDDIVRLIFESN